MKLIKRFVFFLAFFFGPSVWALNICTMTFNSSDEKQAFQSAYASDSQATFTELVPPNKDPQWLQNVCKQQVQCDVLLISGHFGGLFFGEKIIPTLSIEELFAKSCDESCPGIFEKVKSVYLMGCNTLATKKPDHRSIEEYLRVLVNDGFPLENAETVAASRYARFGESIENKMRMIFPRAQVIFGFDSTGPLGKVAGPLLSKALKNSSAQDLATKGASPSALASAFKGFNARTTSADKRTLESRALRCELASSQPTASAVATAFAKDRVRENFDAALEMTDFSALKKWLAGDSNRSIEFMRVGNDVLNQTKSMLGLQKRVHDLYKNLDIISPERHRELALQTFTKFFAGGLDYLRTEQLCYMAESTPGIRYDNLPAPEFGSFHGVLATCFQNPRGESFKNVRLGEKSELERCLLSQDGRLDWYCLTSQPQLLNLNACLFAAQRNPDIENGDNMRWFCWERLRERRRINQPQCLALSKSMNILGNRIKSNWNCLNTIR